MARVRLVAAALMVLVGCSLDADVPAAGSQPLVSCNLIAGTGCAQGEKCTYSMVDRNSDCFVAGRVPEDSACSFDEITGVDDCRPGLYCAGGVCTRICGTMTDANCVDGEECRAIDAFHDREMTGVCVQTTGLMKPWWSW